MSTTSQRLRQALAAHRKALEELVSALLEFEPKKIHSVPKTAREET